MGDIRRIRCRSCKSEWVIRTGCGLQHGNLGKLVELFEAKEAQHIGIYSSQIPPVMYDFRYEPAICSACSQIISVPVLEFPEQDEKYTGVCPVCRRKVKNVEKIENIACPICNENLLEENVTGEWD
ncbi:MAG: hypothetical protein PUD93_02465 [Lachnospiraceae bacterium]|nr:hypothetical protein [Lachnospiraceae bacterium]